MHRVLLEKETYVTKTKLSVPALFSDYAADYFQAKVDNHKMLQNLYWESLLTAPKKPVNYLVLGNDSHSHAIYHELNNKTGHVARLVSPHPRDLNAAIRDAGPNARLLACGELPHIQTKIKSNDLLALREIWPETSYSAWKLGLETIDQKRFADRYVEQLLIAETDGHVRIKRGFYSMRKSIQKMDLALGRGRRGKRPWGAPRFENGWSSGILNINKEADESCSLSLNHLRYTGDTLDFHFAKQLKTWLENHSGSAQILEQQGHKAAYLSSSSPIISSFIHHYLVENTPLSATEILMSDVLFGNNFPGTYLSFMAENNCAIMIDMNHFPDVYIWHKSGAGVQ